MSTLDDQLVDKIRKDIQKHEFLFELSQDYQIEELTTFNEFNLGDKLKQQLFVSEQFRLLYLSEKHDLLKIENLFAKVQGEKYDHYKHEYEKNLTKTEIEKYYLPKDEKILKLKVILDKQAIRCDFFESMWKLIDGMAWKMKLFVTQDTK